MKNIIIATIIATFVTFFFAAAAQAGWLSVPGTDMCNPLQWKKGEDGDYHLVKIPCAEQRRMKEEKEEKEREERRKKYDYSLTKQEASCQVIVDNQRDLEKMGRKPLSRKDKEFMLEVFCEDEKKLAGK